MDLAQLRTFQSLARHGSVTAAAGALGYTQSAVSRQLSALEADLDVLLFDRLPRGVALTEEGRILLAHTDAVLERVEDARRDLVALRELSGGALRVGAFPTAVAALIPRAMATFRAAHPGVALSLVEGTTPRQLARLAVGDIHVAAVSAPAGESLDGERFDLRHLLDDRLLVALPRSHRLAGRRTLRLAELADESWIAGEAGPEDTLLRAGLPRGVSPRIDFVAREWTAKQGLVAAGLGVTLVPALAAGAARGDLALVALHRDDWPARGVYVATPRGRAAPPAVGRFTEILAGVAAELPR